MNLTRRVLLTLPIVATGPLKAQESYPVRPITLVIPSVAGGILDTIGRIVGRSLEPLGQTVVYQNVPGAGSILGTDVVAKAAADGYTLAVVAASHAINPSVYPKMPYDTGRDLAPVAHTVNLTNLLVVNPAVQANNLQELIALAKQTGQPDLRLGGHRPIEPPFGRDAPRRRWHRHRACVVQGQCRGNERRASAVRLNL